MIKSVAHIGLTVTNLERSIEFYRDILGLVYKGQMLMDGPETEKLFNRKGTTARIAYLNYAEEARQADVELIEFTSFEIEKSQSSLFQTSISEICFGVEDIDKFYQNLLDQGVEVLSEPQEFDSTAYGFGKSKAIYFKDPDGIILEAIESL